MQKVIELAEIKHKPVVAHPQNANNLDQQRVQTLGKMLKAYAMELPGSWDVALSVSFLPSEILLQPASGGTPQMS